MSKQGDILNSPLSAGCPWLDPCCISECSKSSSQEGVMDGVWMLGRRLSLSHNDKSAPSVIYQLVI